MRIKIEKLRKMRTKELENLKSDIIHDCDLRGWENMDWSIMDNLNHILEVRYLKCELKIKSKIV